jgi:hypothetical protein
LPRLQFKIGTRKRASQMRSLAKDGELNSGRHAGIFRAIDIESLLAICSHLRRLSLIVGTKTGLSGSLSAAGGVCSVMPDKKIASRR